LETFSSWLSTIEQEHTTPDLWASITAGKELLQGDPEDRGGFSRSERKQLSQALRQIEEFIVGQTGAIGPQRDDIAESINHLDDAASRLTKKDWKILFVGGLISLLIAIGSNPSVFRATLQFAATHVMPLLGTLRLPGLGF
jgi:hypothetical protein